MRRLSIITRKERVNIMKRIFAITLYSAVAAMLLSCEKPENNKDNGADNLNPPVETPDTPEDPAEQAVNSYIHSGEEYRFGSVLVSNFGEYLCIAASKKEGVTSFEKIFEQEEYFYVAITPMLNGKEFDLMTETKLYTVISTLRGAELETVAPEMKEEIQRGSCTFTYNEGKTTVDISLALADGTELTAKMEAEESIVVNENIITVNGTSKPIRTAFYKSQDGTTEIYLTPAGISYSEELAITTYYTYFILQDNQCNGKTIMASEIMEAGIVDNTQESIISSATESCSGTVNVLKDAEDPSLFTIVASIDLGDTVIDIHYNGNAIDYNLKPEIVYEVIYGKRSYKINEVTLDKTIGNDLWKVTIESEGKDFTITMPSAAFDGNAKGFSQFKNNPDVMVTYGENVYNYASGHSGTITVCINGENIHVEFTNYNDLQVLYEGGFTLVE